MTIWQPNQGITNLLSQNRNCFSMERNPFATPRSVNYLLLISALLLLCVLVLALLVKHPRTVEGRIVLVANSRTYELLAPQTGRLVLLSCPTDTVWQNADIAYVFKSCNYQAVSTVQNLLTAGNWEQAYLCLCDTALINQMGELGVECNNLRLVLYEWFNFEQINQVVSRLNMMHCKDSAYANQLTIETQVLYFENVIGQQMNQMCHDDSALFVSGHVSRTDLNQSVRNLLLQKHKIESQRSVILSLRQEQLQNKMELNNYIDEMTVKKQELRNNVETKISDLLTSIELWRGQSVITAPQSGRFELYPNVSDRQMVVANSPVIRSIPTDEGKLTGEVLFESKESGSLIGGEPVKITLDSYAPNEYGYLMGEVLSYSSSVFSGQSAETSLRMAKVSIDMTDQPFWWANLHYVHGMSGKSEIIVEERSLIEQIFNFLIMNTN